MSQIRVNDLTFSYEGSMDDVLLNVQFEKLVDEIAPKIEEDTETESSVTALPFDEIEEENKEEIKEIAEVPEIAEPLEDAAETEEDDNYDSYDAIVLVPAVANPPVSDDPDYQPVEKTASAGRPVNPVEPVLTKPCTGSYDSLVVNSEKDLIRNSYYVQIATMRDDANILEVVNKYGNNYPITIVQLSNNSKQILIGSLSMDEYAVVLERFKSYGYKDAFLRKIR